MAEAVRGSNMRGCGVSGSTRGRPALVSVALPRTPNPDGSSPRAGANSLHGRRHTSLGKGPAAPQELDTCPCASVREEARAAANAAAVRPAPRGRGLQRRGAGPCFRPRAREGAGTSPPPAAPAPLVPSRNRGPARGR